MSLEFTVDTRQFQKNFAEYMKWSKRGLREAVNQHGYYIARNAVNATKSAKKEDIRKDLETLSKKYPKAPLAAILVNAKRAKEGKKGLTGEKMAKAVETFIKKAQASRNFLRAGWIPAVKKMAPFATKKGGKPIPDGARIKGSQKGGAYPARESLKPVFVLFNSVFGGKKASLRVKKIIQEGAQIAVDQETASMREYILKKMEEAAKKANWGG